MHSSWDKFDIKLNDIVKVNFNNNSIKMHYATTFGDVEMRKPLIMKDDYDRVEVALNQDSFEKKYKVKIGDDIVIKK